MSRLSQIEKSHLGRALDLAKTAWGETHPNPMVGAVIAEDDNIVSEGFHAFAGGPHAEVVAMRELASRPNPEAVLYVTLEPCSTHGRTPPCVQSIVDSGIRRVVVGTPDPNPAHAGRGVDLLRNAGIEVMEASGEIAEDCADLNLIFNHGIVESTPFIALKLAVTSDEKLTEKPGVPSEITGSGAKMDVMSWRRYFPAIAVGAGTVLADDPRLTARLPEGEWCPRRIILDGRLSTVSDAEELPMVYTDSFREKTLVVTGSKNPNMLTRLARLENAGVSVRELPLDESGSFRLTDLRSILTDEDLGGVFFEGGAKVARRLLEEKFLNYLFWYQSSKRFPGEAALTAPELSVFPLGDCVRRENFGNDVLIRGHLNFNGHRPIATP